METDYSEWVRHFDNLMWTVTSIMVAANGALLVYAASEDNFAVWLAVGGVGLSFLGVYFAASMRELRQRFQARLDDDTQSLISDGRKFYQWPAFVGVFLALVGAWTWLLVRSSSSLLWVALAVATGIAVAVVGAVSNRIDVSQSDA